MIALTPEQISEAAYALIEGAAYAGITKDPAVLPGMKALGASFTGIAAGTLTYAAAESAAKLLLTELGVTLPPELQGVVGILDGVNTQLATTTSKTAPPLTDGLLKTVLTVAGNAITAACALYVTNNPAVAPAPPAPSVA